MAQARSAQAQGRTDDARRLWLALSEDERAAGPAHNALGNLALAAGDPRGAIAHFRKALDRDPGQPALLFNLSAAARAAGDLPGALAALDEALAADPYFVQAIFQKGVLYEEAGDRRAAARIYRDFLDTVPPEVEADARFAAPLARARAAVAADDAALAALIDAQAAPPGSKAGEAIAILTGRSRAYRSEPTFLDVPQLPSIPFLDPADVPWLAELEAGFETIRREAQAVFAGGLESFAPYVANAPGTPLNQWAALDHNRDWGAFFLYRHGKRAAANCARMPGTSALLDGLPLLELAGRAPNAFLSRLAPRTRIPPHNGVTNARITVHLPLFVPPGCGFRVGGETREWVEGRAWAFDDTIEHEAWNDSEQPRLILIVDGWNPRLDAAERAYLASALAAYDRHYGIRRAEGDEL